MILQLAAVAAAISWPSGTRWTSLHSWPDSWGDSPITSPAAPAGLLRLESPSAEAWWGESESGGRWTLAAGMPAGRWAFGLSGGIAADPGAPDSVFAGVSAGRTLTGDPHGFIRNFFGPSICLGASVEVRSAPDGDGPSGSACTHLQFSVFPTLSVGATLSGIGLFGPGEDGPVFGYGGTYIFNRQLRGHLGYRDDGASAGAELCLGDFLTFSAGTDGHSWSAGLGIVQGRIGLGYSVTMCDTAAFHGLSLSWSPGAGVDEW